MLLTCHYVIRHSNDVSNVIDVSTIKTFTYVDHTIKTLQLWILECLNYHGLVAYTNMTFCCRPYPVIHW